MKKHFKPIAIIIIILLISAIYFSFSQKRDVKSSQGEEHADVIPPPPEKQDRVEKIEIIEDSTYGSLMSDAGINYSTTQAIYEASQDVYDLVKIRLGRFLELVYDKDTDEFKELKYQIDSEEELHVRKTKKEDSKNASSTEEISDEWEWVAERIDIPYEIRVKTSEGIVESSMYQAALDHDIDERAIIELANAFQWSIDFAMDPRKGDTFKFIYEERYLNGEYVMPGKILAGKYINAGEEYYVYYFEEDEDNIGYFDEDGNSVQKMFLKSPVEFKYISSGYTTGTRVVMEIGLVGPHMAIDYAAACGTPIRAVGNGTVTSAGWNSGGYGNLTKIRHNGTYSTNYAHQSKIIVKYGQKVEQGQTIGYVGTTGYSTGCHLHFEMVKNGVKIDPLKEVLPPGKPIKDENKERFFSATKKWQDILNS